MPRQLTTFSNFIATSVSLLFAVLVLGGCDSKLAEPTRKEVAACIAKNMSEDQAYLRGEALAQHQDTMLTRWDAWGCDHFMTVFSNKEERKEVGLLVNVELMPNKGFRKGLYAGIAPVGFSRQQRAVLSELGMALEAAATNQQQAVRCDFAEPEAVALVSQIDFPFAMAVIGIRADIGNTEVVRQLAEGLIERAQSVSNTLPPPSCAESKKETFLKYAQDMHDFYAGKHPWAPGCGVESTTDGMKLKCTGVGQALKK